MSEVKSTRNLDIFKKLHLNVPLESSNLTRVENSILSKNLLSIRPIDVTSDMEVIDGQHRLEVARKHGLEIFYRIKEDYVPEDVYLLQNQRTWNAQHFLHFYAELGNQNYIKMREFLKKRECKINQIFSIFCMGKSGSSFHLFNEGKFIFPEPEFMRKIESNFLFLDMIRDIIKLKTLGNKSYINSTSFVKSVFIFLLQEESNAEFFVKKVEKHISLVHSCTTGIQYLEMWKGIYNYKCHRQTEFEHLFDKNYNPLKRKTFEEKTYFQALLDERYSEGAV